MLPNCGRVIDLGIWSIDGSTLEKYLNATSTTSPIQTGTKLIPPVMLTAEILRLLMNKLDLPSGTVHSGQEINAYNLVRPDQYVLGWAHASKPSIKGEWQFVLIDFSLTDENYRAVLKGKTTVMVPVN